MAWFGRRRGEPEPAPEADTGSGAGAGPAGAGESLVADGASLQPVVARVPPQDRARIDAAVAALAAGGVDLDDLESIGAALDAAYRSWEGAPLGSRADHAAIVERFAMAIGEHLDRHTDLDWQLVTDVFGTDLALTEGFKGSFVVVPHNLVAGRWMRGETGWVPAVVGHLVRRRTRR
ncbi:MAG TPA: DUF3806 domain-containing protein [Pedococcus sp.]|jgi:hypothetical protein